MKNQKKIIALLSTLAVGAIIYGSAGQAGAQVLSASQAGTAGRAAEESYAPPMRQAADGGLIVPETTAHKAPAGAENLHVKPSGLVVEGGFSDMAEAAIEIEVGIKNQRVTGADLFATAAALEAAYARAGYILARVSLPPQTIHDGKPLKLRVTSGYVESIDTSGLPEKVRGRVDAVVAGLAGSRNPNQREIERRLLLAGDTPGVSLTTTLKPGENPGATIIVMEGTYEPVTGSLSVNNGMPSSLGTYSVSSGLEFNDLLGLGEVFYLRGSGYPTLGSGNFFSSDPRNRQIAAGFNTPLGTDGFFMNFEALDSQTHPTSSAGFTMLDHYQRFSTSIGYHWLRSRSANISSRLTFDIANEAQTVDVGGTRTAFTEDRLRVFRFTQSGDYFAKGGGYLSGEITASFGIDGLGARRGTVALPLSRTGAQPNFAKLALNGQYSQPFANNAFLFTLSGQAQTTFGQAVVSSEQLSLGGFSRLSAFGSGDIQADLGVFARAEISYTHPDGSFNLDSLRGNVSPYAFAAAGIAHLERPTAVEKATTTAFAVGIGLRANFSLPDRRRSSSIQLEYAYGTASNTSLQNRSRFNILLQSQF